MNDVASLDDPRIASYIARAEAALGYPLSRKQAAEKAFYIWVGSELKGRIATVGSALVGRCQEYWHADILGNCRVREDTCLRRAVRGLCCYPDDAHMLDMHPDALRLLAMSGNEPALAFIQFAFLLAYHGDDNVE